MKKNLPLLAAFLPITILIIVSVVIPGLVFGQDPLVSECEGFGCTLSDLVGLVQTIINWIIMISAPVAMVMFAYAGILMVTAGGNEGQIKKAQGIFKNVAIGFAIILSAWLIVYTIISAFLGDVNLPVGLDPI